MAKEPTEDEITEEEILEFKRCFILSERSIEMYQTYGPANPLKQRFPGDTCLECKFSDDGICYMLKCRCLEYDPEDDEYVEDWFIGRCNECDSIIEDRSQAWRIPDIYGGFKGCYCEDHFESKFYGSDGNKYLSLCKVIKTIRKKFPVKYGSSINNISNVEEDKVEDYI